MKQRTLLLVSSILFLAVCLHFPRAFAEQSAAQRAQPHIDAAQEAFNDEDYETALREFTAAREIVEEPMLLYNIALCHERMGNLRDAIDNYRRYVREAPEARNADEVEVHIEELHERRVEERDSGVEVVAADDGERDHQRSERRYAGNLIRAHHELDVLIGTIVSIAPGIRGNPGSASLSLEFDYHYRLTPAWSVGVGGLFDAFFAADEVATGTNQKHYGGVVSGRWAHRWLDNRLEFRATAAIGYVFVSATGSFGHGTDFHWVFTRLGGTIAYAIYHSFGIQLRLAFRLGFLPGGNTDDPNFGGTFDAMVGVFWAF